MYSNNKESLMEIRSDLCAMHCKSADVADERVKDEESQETGVRLRHSLL